MAEKSLEIWDHPFKTSALEGVGPMWTAVDTGGVFNQKVDVHNQVQIYVCLRDVFKHIWT